MVKRPVLASFHGRLNLQAERLKVKEAIANRSVWGPRVIHMSCGRKMETMVVYCWGFPKPRKCERWSVIIIKWMTMGDQ